MYTYSVEALTNQEMTVKVLPKLFGAGIVLRGTEITTFCLILSKGLL